MCTLVLKVTKFTDESTRLVEGLIDRLEEINADNDTHSLLPFLLRPPPPFFTRWIHSTAASAFLRPALPHACFSFRPGAVAPPVLGLQGFILQSIGPEHGTEGRGRPGLVALDDGEWCRAVVSGKEARVSEWKGLLAR
ncbi:unnamed protein product [Closterium sp. Naga37s-1]|nr:unnamed protein product [Closterium sp. Naga37s-1]